MEIIAKLKKVHEVVQATETFKKRLIWVTTEFDGTHPQTVEVELHQDRVDIFSGVGVGSEVKLYLNLRGNEWIGKDGVPKVFNKLVCWKVDVLNAAGNSTAPAQGEVESLPF